jgi:hypothetical protein
LPRIGELAAGGLLVMAMAMPANAEIQVEAGGGYRYEDNLFRLPSGASTIPGVQKSDRIASVQGQVDADFHPGDFDGTLTATAAHDWYARNSLLNNFNYSLGVNVQRKPGATVGLSLNVESDRRLSSFSDITSRIRNIQSVQRFDGQVTFPITADLRVVALPQFYRSTNSSSQINLNDYNQYGGGAGIGYYSSIGNSIAITVSRRHTDGLRDRFAVVNGAIENANIDLDDTSVDLRVTYRPGAFTQIDGVISYINRNDKSILNNDYHGPSGHVSVTFAPRSTLRATAEVGRNLDTQSYLFVDSVRSDYVTGSIDAIILDNLQAGVRADYQHRRFAYDPLLALGAGNRIENITRFTASLSWLAFDRLRLGVNGYHEHRSANYLFGNYSANAVQATATIVFGKRGLSLNGSTGI